RNLLATLLIGSALPRRALLFRHRHADRRSKRTHRFWESCPGVLDQKGDCRPVCAAAKAVIELLGRADRERRGFFFMEGAEAKQVGSTLAQLHISPHDVHDVDPGEEILYEGFWYQSIQARGQLLAADTLVVTLDRGSMLALALCGGLFVELARTQLGQQTDFFDGALEAAKRGFEGLVFLQTNDRHVFLGLVSKIKDTNGITVNSS